MRCQKCSAENPPGAKFCIQCAAPFPRRCPKCTFENPPEARFCAQCATPLDHATVAADTTRVPVESLPLTRGKLGGSSPDADAARADRARTGERRHLTVMFCDLVGSTEIAARLDPEEWRETLANYHAAASDAISRFGGYVAKYLGDGVMAYFGWPAAHDNDAERATRAGLAILEGIAKLNRQSGTGFSLSSSLEFSARVGIDSGTVVIGAGAGKDADVFGDVPNIAARVQAAAEPDMVLITAAAHRLISGLFVVEKIGARELKGVPAPIELFRVVRLMGIRGRLGAARSLTPFVGRKEELQLLLSLWERAREGEGQMALVIGEAGIGKSRLVTEFHERIRDTPHIWMESAGEQLFENTPFHAVNQMLSQWLGLQGGANSGEQADRLERALASAGLRADEAAPLVADLLQLSIGDRYQGTTFTREQKRRRLLAVLTGWNSGAARLQPMVMVVEDLHWLDPLKLGRKARSVLVMLQDESILSGFSSRSGFLKSFPLSGGDGALRPREGLFFYFASLALRYAHVADSFARLRFAAPSDSVRLARFRTFNRRTLRVRLNNDPLP